MPPERPTRCWREVDSNLYGAFPVKWLFLVCCRFFVRSGKAVLRPVACDQVRGARGRGQGTETLAKLAACRLAALVFRSALRPEHAEGPYVVAYRARDADPAGLREGLHH